MKYLIAHRGLDNHKYKENSIKGILNSLSKDYVSGIEVDIRFTKDKKIIMYHDLLSDFKIISNTNYNELNNIDLLEDLLKKIKSNKIILFDIKSENNKYELFIEYLLKLIDKYPLNYYLCSFNYNLIKSLFGRTKYPLGIFITDIINKNKNYSKLSFLALSKNSYDDIKFNTKFVWTINSNKNINKYEYIITDKAYLLSK